jgi:proline dehydrogenase
LHVGIFAANGLGQRRQVEGAGHDHELLAALQRLRRAAATRRYQQHQDDSNQLLHDFLLATTL